MPTAYDPYSGAYTLTAPWVIGSNLRPTVRDGGTEISIWAIEREQDDEQRIRFGYEIRQNGKRVITDSDLRSASWADVDLDSALRALLSFASSYGETYDYGRVPMARTDDRYRLGKWWSEHGESLPLEWSYSEDELGE